MKTPPVCPRTVLITGCSSGIGLACARILKAAQWTVLPTARKDADLDRLRAEGFDPIRLDIADAASVEAAARETRERTDGAPGALVNNAGFGQPGAVEDLSRDTMRAQFEVNVFGLQDLTNRLLPSMRKRGAGRIVNISSVVGRVALPFMGIYSASKFAVEALSDAMRVELCDSGVSVSLVEPGPIETSFGANAVSSGKANLDPDRSVFGAAYRQRLDRVATRNQHKEAFRLPPDAVARAVQHALESSHPRRRYAVTFPAHLGAFLARFAPDAVVDRLLLAYVRSNAKEEKPEAGVSS